MAELTITTPLRFQTVRNGPPRKLTASCTVSDADATIAVAPGAEAWLSAPASSSDGIPFDVTLDTRGIPHGGATRLTASLLATADGFDPTTIDVIVDVRPSGPPRRGRASR